MTRYRLNTIPSQRDLDGYLFIDAPHARRWLSQKFVTDAKYTVSLVETTEACERCDHSKVREVLWTKKPSIVLAALEICDHGPWSPKDIL